MRHGWEIKKLGEVCDIINGFAFKSDLFKTEGEGVLRIQNIQNGIVELNNITYFSKNDYPKINFDKYAVYPNDIVVALSGATTGKFGINNTGRILYLNQRVAICREKIKDLNHFYLLYFLRSISKSFLDSAKGVAQPNLSTEQMKQYYISYPSISNQERIVAELDLLSDVIAKKREQLKQLDTLAQSIFYDMFGDPITNEKGWETKKLGETSTLHNGRAFKPTDWSNSGLPIVRIQNLNNPTLPFNYYDGEVANNHRLYGGELLYAWSGTPDTSFGAHIWYGGDAVLNQHIFKIEYNKDLLNIKYFVFNLNGIVNSMFDKTHGGVGLQHITKGTLTSQNICLPPLYLQQQFASKIESIEKQKELIKQSLSEVQQLFDSRMDYYFG